jgi:hypothetical protein
MPRRPLYHDRLESGARPRPLASRFAPVRADLACHRRFWLRRQQAAPLLHIARTNLVSTFGTLRAPATRYRHALLSGRHLVKTAHLDRLAQAAISADDLPGFSEMILVFTGPQSAHWKLWSARSRRVGCGSTTESFIGLRHIGQGSSTNSVRDDMASSFRAWRNEDTQWVPATS